MGERPLGRRVGLRPPTRPACPGGGPQKPYRLGTPALTGTGVEGSMGVLPHPSEPPPPDRRCGSGGSGRIGQRAGRDRADRRRGRPRRSAVHTRRPGGCSWGSRGTYRPGHARASRGAGEPSWTATSRGGCFPSTGSSDDQRMAAGSDTSVCCTATTPSQSDDPDVGRQDDLSCRVSGEAVQRGDGVALDLGGGHVGRGLP